MAAGFRVIDTTDGLSVSVWYPSDAPERRERMGPFDVLVARDAPLVLTAESAGAQPVLISHGHGGRGRNHHLTARALANAGFIAIAPLHTPDHYIGSRGRSYSALKLRAEELGRALEAVAEDAEFRGVIDRSRVHAVGYSIGSVTVLSGAGAVVDGALVSRHCREHDDPGFCRRPGWFVRWRMRRARRAGAGASRLERDVRDGYAIPAFVNGGVAVVAPIAPGIVISDDAFRASAVFVVGFRDDEVNVPRFHAERLRALVPQSYLAHYSLRAGNHWAFIAPFAARVDTAARIMVAQDPPGFDRAAGLAVLNEELVAFFRGQGGQRQGQRQGQGQGQADGG